MDNMETVYVETKKLFHSRTSALLLVSLAFSIHQVDSLAITLKDVECLSENVSYKGDIVFGNFVIMDHDVLWRSNHPRIDFTVTSPSDKFAHFIKGKSADKFEFKANQSGTYKFCFINHLSTPEIVSFYIHVAHIPNKNDLAEDENLNPVGVKIAELREALESVTAEQRYLKACDAQHRSTNESTGKRVILCTVIEYLSLAIASALQILYIHRLFRKSSAYNRV